MRDEAFHEIQINGKQLVFVFMAATVVAVVIFLCGIMVGRGVRAQRVEQAAIAESIADPTASTTTAPSAGTSLGASPATNEQLSYPGRLATESAPPETLREEPASSVPTPAVVPAARTSSPTSVSAAGHTAAPAPARSAALAARPAAAAAVPATDAAEGFTVQVAATRGRAEADAMARRLTSKGYAAYVTTPAGAAHVFRVRVGHFKDRREAEAVAARLEKEEQFKPWITR